MNVREEAIEEIRKAPEEAVAQTLEFLRLLTKRTRAERFGTAIASEAMLARDWDTPEEDEAWKDL